MRTGLVERPVNLCRCPLSSFYLVCFKPKRGPRLLPVDFKTASANQSHRAVRVAGPSVDNFTTTLLTGTAVAILPRSLTSRAACLCRWTSASRPLVSVSHVGLRTLRLAHASRLPLSPLPGLRSSYLGSVPYSLSNSLVRLLPRLQRYLLILGSWGGGLASRRSKFGTAGGHSEASPFSSVRC